MSIWCAFLVPRCHAALAQIPIVLRSASAESREVIGNTMYQPLADAGQAASSMPKLVRDSSETALLRGIKIRRRTCVLICGLALLEERSPRR